MDKGQDIRRAGAGRFLLAKRQINKQSGSEDGGGDVAFSEKSKTERLRGPSIVDRVSTINAESEMGCVGSDGEDELCPTSSVSIKLPRKFFDDCNTVDHASVPRKLRSAMKKRNCSISPPLPNSKKLNHATRGVELPRKNGARKSKLNLQQGDSNGTPRQAIAGPITKDEEEVVETLYALVAMFHNNDKTIKTNLDGEFSEAKTPPLPKGKNPIPTFEDSEVPKKEEDSYIICPSTTSEACNTLSDSEGSGQVAVEKSSDEVSRAVLLNCNQLPTDLDNSIPQVNLPTMSLLSKSEPSNEKLLCNYATFDASSVLSLGPGSKQPRHEETPPCKRKPDIALESAAVVRSQHELQHTINESKRSGLALWPGLSSTRSHDAGTQGPPLQLSAAKIPAWLGNACATQAGTVEKVVLTERDSRILIDKRKLWKRCSTHVYISHLIKVLKIAERKDGVPKQPTQLMPNERSEEGVLTAANNLHEVRNSLNSVVSANGIVGAVAEKNPNEVRNVVLSHKWLLQDQQQASTTSGIYSLQKQSFDFLSLSTGDGWAQADNIKSRAGNGLEPLTQFHVPYLQSLAQNHTAMPSSLPQNCCSLTPFTDHLSAAAAQQVQVQLPRYLGSPFCGPTHLRARVSPEQQQQQRIWATHLAAQYKPGGVAAPYIPNWQNGTKDSSSVIQYAQAILPPSRSSLEVPGLKYTPISHQQQQLIASTSSFPPAKLKRHHHRLPSVYEGNGGGFHPDSALSLQLLYNENL